MQPEQHPDRRPIGAGVPTDVERGELEPAHAEQREPEDHEHDEPDANLAKIVIVRRLVGEYVRYRAQAREAEIHRTPKQVGWAAFVRPQMTAALEVEIDDDHQGEADAFDRRHSRGTPPHEAPG